MRNPLANPWPGQFVKAVDVETDMCVPLSVDERSVRFNTVPNHKYRIELSQTRS